MTRTNPAAEAAIAIPDRVQSALQESAARTGTDFGYLLQVARRESHFRPAAQAPNSTAAGVFQFNEQTWLHMVKAYGAKYGLAAQAAEIKVDADGRQEVPDATARRNILAERSDPRLSALMAGELAQQNRGYMEKRLGRPVSDGEIYAAHVFGANGAVRLIKAADDAPGQRADQVLRGAARGNRNLFYNRGSHSARSAGQVMAGLQSGTRATRGAARPPAGEPQAGQTIAAADSAFDARPTLAAAKAVPLPRSRPSDLLSANTVAVVALGG
jgi:hypothetical protein